MKDILEKVISRIKSEKGGYCRIKHKRGWLEYLEDGDLIFRPYELHHILRQVIDRDDNRPRGDKLFCLRRKVKFTAKEDKSPYRPEEALERFIIVSNPDNFYNQMPIGGRKESIDIVIEESNSKFIFVELKPWESTNSPLYALIESLKNLIEYRIIHERNIKIIPKYDHFELLILAPQAYYEEYKLIDKQGVAQADKITIFKETLNAISTEFETAISFMALQINKQNFFRVCSNIYEDRGIEGQDKITLSRKDIIPVLAKDKWKLVVDSA